MGIKQNILTLLVILFVFIILTAGTVAADIVTVDDSGGANYTSIQDAVNNANNGDTILVYNGLYTENLYVKKELTIRSNYGNPDDTIIQAANSSIHVFNVTADSVTISGFKITGAASKSGIFLEGVKDCIVTNNILLKNNYGISLKRSSNNKLENNMVNSNNWGVFLGQYSNDNTLSNNIINSNRYMGIYLQKSKRNDLIFNKIMGNKYGIYLYEFSNYNILSNNNISYNEEGIHVGSSQNNTISNNLLSNNKNDIIANQYPINNISNNTVLSKKEPIIEGYTLFILMSIAVTIILFITSFKGYMAYPKYQIIQGEGIKTFTGKIIKFNDIKNMEISPKSSSIIGVNSFSLDFKINMPGYHVGTYHILGLGKVKMISTTWFGALVIITTDEIKYAISPENPEQFIKEIKKGLYEFRRSMK